MNREIILNDNIILKKNNQNYIIEFKYTSYTLINSIIKPRLIPGASCDEYYKSISFKAETVKTLNEHHYSKQLIRGKSNLLISEIAMMINTLSKQLKYLIEKEANTLIGYNPNEILVINDKIFIFLGSELIIKINSEDDGMATISFPFSTTDFFVSPELLKIKTIPSLFHFKSCYFSFACLIMYSLLGDDEFYKDYLNDPKPKKLLDVLDNHYIKNTRIYWLLSRCLIEEPEQRTIILI